MQPQLTKMTDGITFEKMADFAKKDLLEGRKKIQTTDLIHISICIHKISFTMFLMIFAREISK
jgi:hypothetical protein